MDNMTKIAPGIYLVRTQAGFRKALKAEFLEIFGDWGRISRSLREYPESYPAIISLSLGYNGHDLILCNSVHVDVLKAAVSDA